MHERFDTYPSYGKFAHAAPVVRKRYSSLKINTIASENSRQNKKLSEGQSLRTTVNFNGRDERIRTSDHLHPMQVR